MCLFCRCLHNEISLCRKCLHEATYLAARILVASPGMETSRRNCSFQEPKLRAHGKLGATFSGSSYIRPKKKQGTHAHRARCTLEDFRKWCSKRTSRSCRMATAKLNFPNAAMTRSEPAANGLKESANPGRIVKSFPSHGEAIAENSKQSEHRHPSVPILVALFGRAEWHQ